jgi:enterochelin esterase-like enzyme
MVTTATYSALTARLLPAIAAPRRIRVGRPLVVASTRTSRLAVVALAAVGLNACQAAPVDDPTVKSISIDSHALGRAMPADIWIPPGKDANSVHSVLILFHGRGADQHQWFQGGVGVQGIATELASMGDIDPPAIVSVFIDDSYGIDSPTTSDGYVHGPYEQYLVDDMIPAIDHQFPLTTRSEARFVGGISMGGYAALRLAFRHPELFAGVGVLSPAIFQGTIADRVFLYPDGLPRADRDPLELATNAPIDGMRVSVGWGTSDYPWIQDASAQLAERLVQRDVRVTTHQVPGGHEIGTWRALAPELLRDLFGAGCEADGANASPGSTPRRPDASPGC